jgi:hypothetical protein
MRLSFTRFNGVWLGMVAGFNLGLAVRGPLPVFGIVVGTLVLAVALLWCREPVPFTPPALHFDFPDFEPPQMAIYQNANGVWDVGYPAQFPTAEGVKPAEATGDFSESVRSLERKVVMKPGSGGLKQLWWHCYGGITTEECSWGEGHWCMVILGESTKGAEEVDDNIQPAGTWTTPLMHLHSYDHDPTDEEKQKITPVDYRDNRFHSEKVRRP